ncbi:MAG: glycerate kinase [Propionibacteriaceae bacterium]|nr:glycerate kinase [Propionibacteriaceae bacterium]
MRIVCAPDSFKESMTALQAAQAMADGVHRVAPDAFCDLVPMADGGEGTVQALIDGLGGVLVDAPCHDALGRPIVAAYGYVASQRLAIIEMAAASGLELIRPQDRDIAVASSFGTGELVLDALNRGASRFIVGIGGSATNDAGAGMCQALGVRFLDADGTPLPPGGAALARLAFVDQRGLDPRLAQCHLEIACDVTNPLLGPNGASAIFGPQKGANKKHLIADLDAALTQWSDVVEVATRQNVRHIPGAGAAGGLGAAFAAFFPVAVLRRGVEIVIDAVHLRDRIADADWVFTGEGSIDVQTLAGKTPWGVAQLAKRAGVPVVMFGGRISDDARQLLESDVTTLVPIVPAGQPLAEALANAQANLADAAQAFCRTLL